MNIPSSIFTQGAMKAMMQAQISAAVLGRDRMGTANLLVGLYRTGEDLTRLMLDGLTLREIEEAVLQIYGRGEPGITRVSGLTPHVQRVLTRASMYANTDKKMLVGVAHIWQELLYESGCSALTVLQMLGRDEATLRQTLTNAVGKLERPPMARHIAASDQPITQKEALKANEAAERAAQSGKEEEHALETYARNLTRAAKAGELEPLIGREDEMRAVIQVLGKKMKNNPLLVGEPGVGKSALAEGLAQRIAHGSVPPALRDAQIYALDLAQLVAGSKYRGEFEGRIKSVIADAQAQKNVILFIDELHTLIGAGSSNDGSLDAANILKPALARGTLRVIGATTYKEYRKYVEKDAALARRFQRVDVREPGREQTLDILRGLRPRYQAYHRLMIADDALTAAVDLSARYVTDRFMPDKAIDLIDEAASMVKLDRWEALPAPRAEETARNETPRLMPETDGETGDAPQMSETDTQADAPTVNNAQPDMPLATEDAAWPILHAREIARVVAQWTGVPVERVGADEQTDMLTLESRLSARVLGQQEAIASLCKALRRARAGLSDPMRPTGVFMLLGPSGVGKTELCKALSEALFGSEEALVRVDMSEYAEEASASRLIGSPPGYVGYNEGGQLTDAVLKRPYSVVLFDEIEKANPKIFSLLLQLLDDGQLTDAVGRKVNFRNTVVVMTSNAGVSFDMDKKLGFAGVEDSPRDHSRAIMAQVKQVFRPEFIGRIDELIVMHSIDQQTGARIASLMLDRVAQRLAARGVTLHVDDAVPALLAAQGVDAMRGARGLRRVIAEQVEDPITDLLLLGQVDGDVYLRAQAGEVVATCSPQTALSPCCV